MVAALTEHAVGEVDPDRLTGRVGGGERDKLAAGAGADLQHPRRR